MTSSTAGVLKDIECIENSWCGKSEGCADCAVNNRTHMVSLSPWLPM